MLGEVIGDQPDLNEYGPRDSKSRNKNFFINYHYLSIEKLE